MKENKLIKLLAAGALSALALSTALAQTSSTTTTTVGAGPVGVSSMNSGSMLDGTGTITTYTPDSDFISMRTSTTTEPVKYYYDKKTTTIVDPEGKTVEWSMLRPDMPVKYTYVKQGDRMVVSKITLTKPVSFYEKTTTTTTTTKP